MAASVANGTAQENDNQMEIAGPEVLKKRASLSTIMESRIDALGSGESREFIWGCELNKEKIAATWTFGAAEEEGDDTDFLVHTLYLRHAVVGAGAAKDERNIIQVETKNFQGEEVKLPIGVLVANQKDSCMFDLNFGHDIPVTFRLIEGNGPIFLTGQHAVEWPLDDRNLMNDTATETETETEELVVTKGKRKASRSPRKGVSKRGRLEDVEEVTEEDEETEETEEEESMDEEDEDDEEEEEEEDDEEEEEESEEEEEEEESEEEVPKKRGRKGKANAAPVKQSKKATKSAPKAKSKPAKGKGRKK